jgi:CubicO group peptidase (beta-lactamase class C family)
MQFAAVDDVFRWAVARGVFPGAVVLVAAQDRVLLHRSYGFRALLPERLPMTADTVFDLSSLTKPIATATAMMLLVRDRKLGLDDAVASVIPSFRQGSKERITFRCLLNHSSGLPAWKPYYSGFVRGNGGRNTVERSERAPREYFWRRIDAEPLVEEPGEKVIYSDLGFMLLGRAIEHLSGVRLDEFCGNLIFSPLGLTSTFFVDLSHSSTRGRKTVPFAATECCPWRERILCGEVHDDNAFAMGGIAGHAGLFSSAQDVHMFLQCLRRCYHDQSPSFLEGNLVRSFFERSTAIEGSTYALGWDTPASGRSSSGRWFSQQTVGHLGFTGTSLWWDLERDAYVVILTNRVHPRRDNDSIKEFRPVAHDVIMEALIIG